MTTETEFNLPSTNAMHNTQVHLKDATLSFEVRGTGPPVLFIQGCGVTGSGWRPQVEELCGEFECLCFDNRGIGRSTANTSRLTVEDMAADARALLDAVGWDSAHVVGHSLGGVIAQQMALDAPDRVRSLSLLCTFQKGCQGGRITPTTIWMSLKTRLGTRGMRRRAFLRMLFPQEYLHCRDTERLAADLAPIIGRDLADQPTVLMRQVKALGAHDCSSRLHELSGIPTLVVSAEKDAIALPDFGRALADAIPGATYVQIGNASHGLPLQEPNKINGLLRAHFNNDLRRMRDGLRTTNKILRAHCL